jgi:dynein heavy chain 2
LKEFKEELQAYREETFTTWVCDIQSSMDDKTLSLATDKAVMEFQKRNNKKYMLVNYNPKLVMIIREVRQLSLLGYKIPEKIQGLSSLAVKYMKQAKALDQVSHGIISTKCIQY